MYCAFSALMLLVGWQKEHPACKKLSGGIVICLKRGADLHTAQLMRLPLTFSCFSKIQIGFSFLVPDHLGSPGKRAVKRVCVCVCVCVFWTWDVDGWCSGCHVDGGCWAVCESTPGHQPRCWSSPLVIATSWRDDCPTWRISQVCWLMFLCCSCDNNVLFRVAAYKLVQVAIKQWTLSSLGY